MKLLFALRVTALAAVLGQPVGAVAVIQVAPLAAQSAATAPRPMVEPEEAVTSGPLVAGLAGLIVLVLVFSRRKAGLPEVVS